MAVTLEKTLRGRCCCEHFYKKAMAFGGMGDFILDGYLMADLEAHENDVVEREKLMMLNRTKKPGVTQSLRKQGGMGQGA